MTIKNDTLRRSLELLKDGEWNKAHDLVDGLEVIGAAHIHAYLHRIEGDKFNAQYWYNRAGRDFPDVSLSQELEDLWKMYGA